MWRLPRDLIVRAERHVRLETFSSREEIERVCIRNLLTSDKERVFFKDLESRFILVSAGWLEGEGQGLSLQEVIGKTDFDIFSMPHAVAAMEDEQRIIRTGEPIVAKLERETFHDRPDAWVSTTKMPLLDEHGGIIGTFGIARDVTAQIEAQQALAHQALRDSVTGLANRIALMDRLGRALVGLERQPGRLALVFIDLDDFKGINDTLGHDVGDRVLAEVGRRLTRVARRVDTVARFGGDEFVLLYAALRDDDELQVISERVLRAICAPFQDRHRDVTVTASIGVVLTSDPLHDPSELLQQADIAMYQAKRAGRNRLQIYNAELHGRVESNRGLAVDLRRVIDHSELFVLYQPLCHLEDGSLSGVEALVRWHHPERGVLLPAGFISLAEQRGLIGAIDEFVLDEACRQLAAWTSADGCLEELTMAVNVSGSELQEFALVTRVSSALERHRITPSRLCLEITETALIGELGDVLRTIASLSALGVRIALDDFGTGYSTFAHLQQLPADILKIDRSFVAQLSRQSRGREILAAVISLAHALGMTVVGEGIETDAQRDELAALHCDEGQGYLFAAPLRPSEIAALWGAARRLPAGAIVNRSWPSSQHPSTT
jgi:diguanylate cyclase (GGDEF)-like protein/PAS domain S-box-containing protein